MTEADPTPDPARETGPETAGTATPVPAPDEADDGDDRRALLPGAFIGQPAKVMRIGTMVKQLLEEVRSAPLDEAARGRLADVHDRTVRELEDGLSPDLVAELRRLSLPLAGPDDDGAPSESELRVAQAQLVGWLEGLFHGLQTALVAQRMSQQAAQAAQQQRALPPGAALPGGPGLGAPDGSPREERHPGQYL